MKAELRIDCKNCIEDIHIDVVINGKNMSTMKDIRDAVSKQGWSLGRDCYCPTCLQNLPAHCETCEHFEGNKSMGSPVCRLDGRFTTGNDYCEKHELFHNDREKDNGWKGYINPIPEL